MSEFLASYERERDGLLQAVSTFEGVWDRFQDRRALDVEGQDQADGLIASELSLVRQELQTQRFTIGVFGLIKRGKSTLLNGMLGQEVSTMHVTPETAVPVHVEYGPAPAAWVHFADGTSRQVDPDEVVRYTSQKHNANNRLGVLYVHRQLPVSFLQHGAALIDTPGLDDAQADEVYTERTMQELDAADAGIVVFLSPPTVGATELKFLQQVAASDLKKSFLVCNMYPDHFNDPETRNAVLQYVGTQVAEAARRAGSSGQVRIYPVCALQAWKAQQDGDLDAFRASGVALLRRHLEQFLSTSASQQVLTSAARRVAHAAELAKNDAAVRLRLLDDHDQLASMRAQMDAHVATLAKEFDTEVATRLAEVEALRKRCRSQILQPLRDGRLAAEQCRTIDDIEAFTSKFSRRMEVQAEQASRTFQQGFDTIVSELRHSLEERFAAVMTDVTGTATTMRLSHNMMVLDPSRLAAEKKRADASSRTKIGSAAVGSVTVGGVLTVAATMLGPIGLIAGAVAGYKLGDALGAGRAFQQTLDEVLGNIEQIGVAVTHEFDDQVAVQLDRVRAAVQNQRRSFASDMYQQFNIVERLSSDPAALEQFRQDTNQFIAMFDRCTQQAWAAIGSPQPA